MAADLVMRTIVITAVLLGACAFEDPSFDGTSFTCDDAHPCPSPQQCLGGTCRTIASTADGVKCGTAGQCAPGETCCASAVAEPTCLPAGQDCSGNAATCDGAEDCGIGEQCCDNSEPRCDAAGCSPPVCSSDEDCSGTRPNCCFLTPSPWGICSLC
ncbi:MAG TPA: hypothetical protein VM513_36140 [Kofleriaceae bacterium]|nr:hypothetical protein [Kofleriaceae bacterium]